MAYRDVNYSLQRNPMVVPAVMLAAGIAVGSLIMAEPWMLAVALAGVVACLLCVKKPMVQTALLYIAVMMLGMLLFSAARPQPYKVAKANAVQRWVDNEYEKAGIANHHLLTAMTVGRTADTRDAVNDARQAYNTAGVAHLLALSGLHVGFFYAAVLWLAMKRRHNAVVQVAVLSAVWMYVMLTGGAASTVRAGLMVSLHALSLMLYRPPLVMNTVALSALIILIISPLQLFDLGFILSFGAVLAILIYVPLLMPRVENKMLRWLCASVCVSVAAQIGVAPVQACVFGQMTPYFLVCNMVVIPVAMVVIYGAMTVLLLSPLPALQSLVGDGIGRVMEFMDGYIHHIAALPGAEMHVTLNIAQTICCYVLIVAIALVIKVLKD